METESRHKEGEINIRLGNRKEVLFGLPLYRYAVNLCVMKKVSIMEAQHNLSKVLQQVEEGQAVYVTRRKKVVAKIVAPGDEDPVSFPDFAKRARHTWGGKWSGSTSSELLDESRGGR